MFDSAATEGQTSACEEIFFPSREPSIEECRLARWKLERTSRRVRVSGTPIKVYFVCTPNGRHYELSLHPKYRTGRQRRPFSAFFSPHFFLGLQRRRFSNPQPGKTLVDFAISDSGCIYLSALNYRSVELTVHRTEGTKSSGKRAAYLNFPSSLFYSQSSPLCSVLRGAWKRVGIFGTFKNDPPLIFFQRDSACNDSCTTGPHGCERRSFEWGNYGNYFRVFFSPRHSAAFKLRFSRLKRGLQMIAVYQHREVLTFSLFDLQPFLEIQRGAMT